MNEFLRKHDATVKQQHDLIYAMFILSLWPAKDPLYQNVKLLIKVNDIYSKNQNIDATIESLEMDDSEVVDLNDAAAHITEIKSKDIQALSEKDRLNIGMMITQWAKEFSLDDAIARTEFALTNLLNGRSASHGWTEFESTFNKEAVNG